VGAGALMPILSAFGDTGKLMTGDRPQYPLQAYHVAIGVSAVLVVLSTVGMVLAAALRKAFVSDWITERNPDMSFLL